MLPHHDTDVLMLRQSDPLHRWAQVLLAGGAVIAEAVAPAAVDRNVVSFLDRAVTLLRA